MLTETRWQSPSNIAIVKYWGKQLNQIPLNPSLSFTLSVCQTDTKVFWRSRNSNDQSSFEFFLDGIPKPSFEPKILSFLQRIKGNFPWLPEYFLSIYSTNSFPHSSGIASSASAMSALALNFCSFDQSVNCHQTIDTEHFLRKASQIARLGSGSACRSLFPYASIWGEHPGVRGSSNEFGIPSGSGLHPCFKTLQDYILIVSSKEKPVSSSAGHELMAHHLFKDQRIQQASMNMTQLIECLGRDNWFDFIEIAEREALSLHALMMTSQPSYILLEPDSLRLIHEIRKLRSQENIPVGFTIDAGPNIHLLFPSSETNKIEAWLASEFSEYLQPGRLIRDRAGSGPLQII